MLFFLFLILSMAALTFFSAPPFVWLVLTGLSLIYLQAHWMWFALFAFLLVFVFTPLIRRGTLSYLLMRLIQKIKLFPRISKTEKQALEAGSIGVEQEFFSGRPKLKKLFSLKDPKLSPEEENFLNNETETLCSKINDWEIYKTRQIPQEVDQFIREKKFLGMIIPKKYGGLGFSHQAHSRILEKICSVSYAVGIYVMVPNSLGPGELLIHYGTDEQKKYYLPRLARGEEIPCFGLTEPEAGSDAANISSSGVLFKEDGELKIRLNWEKRWITLASIASVLGIAFKLEDPEELLGRGKHIGITCALVPASSPGIERDQRHDPMGIPFPNSPMRGRDVIISAEKNLIGGLEQAGQGWAMLMECLGVGRGISLPSLSLASMKKLTRVSLQHAAVREQFGLPLARFEGVGEVLARMGGRVFSSQALLDYTLSSFSQNEPSPLCSAMSKYQLTEAAREVSALSMDVLAGAGLSMGPKNLSALSYIGAPIAITVEGANILTRSFIIFGQGLLRAHPFARHEIQAIEEKNLRHFDRHFWNHAWHIFILIVRTLFLSLTRGFFVFVPDWGGFKGLRAWQKISWAAALFALLSEMAMIGLGGKLKLKEKLTGRFADALMGLTTASAVLWSWKREGKPAFLYPFVRYGVEEALSQSQRAFEGILSNFKVPLISGIFQKILFPVFRLNPLSFGPGDHLSSKLPETLITDPEKLNTLTKNIYSTPPMDKLKRAHELAVQVKPSIDKIKKAVRRGDLEKKPMALAKQKAFEKGVINKEELEALTLMEEKRRDVIQVDSFTKEEYFNLR